MLLALDLDGTLLGEDKTISKDDIEALTRAHKLGIKIVLITGRPIELVRRFLEINNLTFIEIISAMNGTRAINNTTGEELSHVTIGDAQVKQIVQMCRELGIEYTVGIGDRDIQHAGYKDRRKDKFYATLSMKPNYVDDPGSIALASKVSTFVLYAEKDKIGECKKRVEGMEGVTISDRCESSSAFANGEPLDYFAITPIGTDKGTSLEIIAKRLGESLENTVAIGDDMNDWPMLKKAGLGIAMGNAKDKIKEVADLITANNRKSKIIVKDEKGNDNIIEIDNSGVAAIVNILCDKVERMRDKKYLIGRFTPVLREIERKEGRKSFEDQNIVEI